MARTNKNVDWAAVEGAYRSGENSIRSIADKYGVTEAAIRQRAKKLGWTRDPEGAKREIVKARLSGVTSQLASQDVVRSIEAAAGEDVVDMERGLRIHRHCLISLEAVSETSCDPKEIKIIVDAASAAIDAIRKIRGLDRPNVTNVTVSHAGSMATKQEIESALETAASKVFNRGAI